MKKIMKTILSLTAASAMLLSTTVFAQSVSTVTTYNGNGKASIKSTVSGVATNQMITYIATKDNGNGGYDVAADGSNIVYIGQKTATGSTVVFEYDLTNVTGATYAQVKSGSSTGAVATGAEKIGYGNITVNKLNAYGEAIDADCVDVSKTEIGNGETANVTLTAKNGYEIIKIKVNGNDVALQNTISVKAGAVVDIYAIPTANAGVYMLDGAKLDVNTGYDANATETLSALVKVTGNTVEYCYFQFKDDNSDVLEIDGNNKFYVNGSETSELPAGYYGVEIVGGKGEISNYNNVSAMYKEVDGSETAVVTVK